MSTTSMFTGTAMEAFASTSHDSFGEKGILDPIRAELYGLEALEARAREIAAARVDMAGYAGESLLRRLNENEVAIERARSRAADSAEQGAGLAPDAEWLLDNSYIITEALTGVRRDLPRGYYRELPKLVEGPLAGYPRVYALAISLIAHTDSSLDESHILRFVGAFQEVAPLTIGELWAIPTMLRLGLIENLRRLSEHMLGAWRERDRADTWTAPLVNDPSPSLPPFPKGAASSDMFVVQTLRQLRDHGPSTTLEMLKTAWANLGIDAAATIARVNHVQAVNQVSIGNCVTSLRLLDTLDWHTIFEHTSLVEPVLRDDPADAYIKQDFATRDNYRKAVEKLAAGAKHTELQVAEQAVKLAQQAKAANAASPADHVGYYLVGPGLAEMKRAMGYRTRPRDWLGDWILAHPRSYYFGAIFILTGFFLLATLAGAISTGSGLWLTILVGIAALLPVSELAVGIANFITTIVLPPRTLPKLDFKTGIPADCATFVVMPSMLVRPQSAASLLERLEIHYLANPDPLIRFALLTDFADAPTEHLPTDDGFVRSAIDGVAALNRRYSPDGPPRFFLFHRRRLWNPSQGCWMGWERKRGKLAEFNRLLRGDRRTSYEVCSTKPEELPAIRFVITLDLDTHLPRECARRLIGALAHPLNRPRFDSSGSRVVEGYAVLQPRIGFHLATARSRFTRVWTASAGVDPYSTAVSDVYQDLFGAGTFTGKGIYDIDAFEQSTGAAFPDNSILSHDLIEGNFARCGLVTDIELFDDFPARYHAYARREHRWIRGDWQLLPWLRRRIPAEASAEKYRSNPLPLLERWKIVDNLRRSLVPPALILWLAVGWLIAPLLPWAMGAVVLLVLTLPFWLQTAGTIIGILQSGTLAPLRQFQNNVLSTLAQTAMAAVFLLNQAVLGADAIGRTLIRMFITRRNLLQWETAASVERRLGNSMKQFFVSMWLSCAVALALGLVVILIRITAIPAMAPFLVAWLLAPMLAYWISQMPAPSEAPLSQADRREARRIARQTWGFFETFVGAADNWLPPDNFQEEPQPRIAHRTSPTNMGMLLLSTLSAHDLGYLGFTALLERMRLTLDTFDRLERYRGHFLNWYDTKTLLPLPPAYVSTVDSGNLMGCLITLKQGLLEKSAAPFIDCSIVEGIHDCVEQLFEALIDATATRTSDLDFRSACDRLRSQPPSDLLGWPEWLVTLRKEADCLGENVGASASHNSVARSLAAMWIDRLIAQIRQYTEDVDQLAPWLPLLREPQAESCVTAMAQTAAHALWLTVRQRLVTPFSVAGFESGKQSLQADLASLAKYSFLTEQDRGWLLKLANAVGDSTAGALLQSCRDLAQRAGQLADETDFQFLYRDDRHLFAVGYNVAVRRLDTSCYDLLASEARLASFLAIAHGDAPREHWFHLGRLVTPVGSHLCLLSWGGTMFEYLMPDLMLRRFPGTLLAESGVAAVAGQIAFGHQRGVPWGVSESAYAAQHLNRDYQYQAFGVPGLGLKRGLARDLVIAPYATALAAMVRPHDALENFRRLDADGADGKYGYYEAIDFTPDRLPAGRKSLVVRCFMAHHQGMTLVALANCLLDNPMPRRFHTEPMVRATELLLQERIPAIAYPTMPPEQAAAPAPTGTDGALTRRITTPFTASPRVHLVSNGRYTVMITNSGGSFSRSEGLDVSRWREDSTRDDTGQFCYVRDLTTGALWSTTYQPVGRVADRYEVLFSVDKAEFRRVDGAITTHMEVTVCPENPAELRIVTLTNNDERPRDLELTSYVEVVLAPHVADLAHPAFGKLFLETEWVPASQALLCRRRPRSPEQSAVWAVHVAGGPEDSSPQYETDRLRFIGRGGTMANPAAIAPGATLSGTTGPVLDPILSLRRRVRLGPGESASVVFCTAVAGSRAEAIALADHYRDLTVSMRAFDLAWAESRIELRHLRMTAEEAHLCQRLAAALIYTTSTLRADAKVLSANRQGQTALWRYGISGDRPILLARIGEADDVALVHQLLVANTYWRLKGLEVDVIILIEQPTNYLDELFRQVQDAIRGSDAAARVDQPGGVFIKKADQMPAEDRMLLEACARVVLQGRYGSVAAQLHRSEPAAVLPLATKRESKPVGEPVRLPDGLLFANGFGGFAADGREYCIWPYAWDDRGTRLALPPAPWINVIANPIVGCLVSESGLGYTWAFNSQQNRVTPWSNDPVLDTPGEVVYLRDELSGTTWTPTPQPLGSDVPTLVRHGAGYSIFKRQSHGLKQEMLVFVPTDASVKVVILRLLNVGDRPRRVSATYYAEWVLGTDRDQAPLTVRTEVDAEEGAVFAFNPFSRDYGDQVAFLDVDLRPRTVTADRATFLGRNGSVSTPAAQRRPELDGKVGPGLDPCAAIRTTLELQPNEEQEVHFFLGAAPNSEKARELLRQFKEPGRVQSALSEVQGRWDQILSAVQVRTPDRAFDVLVNRWLLYQVLGCRLWGRSAFYQSGGAYGFRDQLQDGMALVHAAPEETRRHLLRSAARQFMEGDVQHWWHPPAGRGVRTRISDDFLWLPFATCQYVGATGDAGVLDEIVPFIRAPLLAPGQEDAYGEPEVSGSGTLYEHCLRAMRNGLHFGEHGLPLMGTGDWNDGMNRVGVGGRGETVWGGWFLATVLRDFAALAESRNDAAIATEFRSIAEKLRQALEEHGWDGAWYRRAYFDDGTPLGSAQNAECQIDSIPQSWAVLSDLANGDRAKSAMQAVYDRLVRSDDRLSLLFTPPFDDGPQQPGYIKGYVPGIRENGGQYTHAAAWVVQAAARLGQGTKAHELFDLLNPLRRSDSQAKAARYMIEPYVMSGDVYAPPHAGRGGWSWYTGSAAWLHRAAIESILGIRRVGNRLAVAPCIPANWPGFEVDYRFGKSTIRIVVENPRGVENGIESATLDGSPCVAGEIMLADDGRNHDVRVLMGPKR